MLNLTETTYWTRRILKVGGILLIAILVLRIGYSLFSNVWRKLKPPAPPPPTVDFGKLPKIEFPKQQDLPKLTFKLETIQGGLPKFPTTVKVYFTPKPGSNLLALDRASQQARQFGFKTQAEEVDEKTYRWRTETPPYTTLEINTNTGNFHLYYDYLNDQETLNSKDLPTNQQAAQEAKNFLANNNLLPDEIATGSAEFQYLKFYPEGLKPALSLSEADFVRVNLFKANLDDLRIFPPNPKNSLISFLFSGNKSSGKRIIEIKYVYYPIRAEVSATYPLKAAQKAWQELQGGENYIANLGENSQGSIIIRQVYLAYFESEIPQHYLQPIYVFEGDNNFFGYVPAVSSEWME
jgi:hypothetical protein